LALDGSGRLLPLMSDSLDRSTSALGLLGRLLALVAVILVVPPVACVGIHNLRHPAPLGRSEEAILAHLDAALPPGSRLESAAQFLTQRGGDLWRYDSTDAAHTYGQDTLWAQGPVLAARLPAVTRGLYVWDGVVHLYFTPDGRLARRTAHLSARDPL
jgi:hypothetical protein